MGQELFDYVAQKLEALTELDRLEARGTLRIVLKGAGLEIKSLSLHQLAVVFKKLMPQELEGRQVEESEILCGHIIQEVRSSGRFSDESESASPDVIFDRLGGR